MKRMSKSREQSNILNGGEIITNHSADAIALTIEEYEDQAVPLMMFDRALGQFEPMEIIDTSTNMYVQLSGSDATGDGTIDKPWATPHKAMEYLQKRAITGDDTLVTINVGAGEYTFTSPIVSNHPYGSKIYIKGADLIGPKPGGVQIASWQNSRTNPTVPERGPNMLSNRSGTMSAAATEAQREAQQAIDYDENETFIKGRFATVFNFTNGSVGFRALGGDIGLIDKIAIIGDNTEPDWATGRNSIGVEAVTLSRNNEAATQIHSGKASKIMLTGEVSIHGFTHMGVFAGHGSTVQVAVWEDNPAYSGITVSGCGHGIAAGTGGYIAATHSTIQGCKYSGILSSNGGTVTAMDSISSGGLVNGYYAIWGGSISALSSHSTGNGYSGYESAYSGNMTITNSYTYGNFWHGLHSTFSGSLHATGIAAIGNNSIGIFSTRGGTINSVIAVGGNRTYCINNGGGGVYATHTAVILANNMYVYNNNGPGVAANFGATVRMINDPDISDTWRTTIIENGGHSSGQVYAQVHCLYNGTVDVAGAIIRRRNYVDYYAIYCGIGGVVHLSANHDGEYPYYATTLSFGTGATTYPLVRSFQLAEVYDTGSNLSPYASNSNYYSPLGNVLSSNGSWNAVYPS